MWKAAWRTAFSSSSAVPAESVSLEILDLEVELAKELVDGVVNAAVRHQHGERDGNHPARRPPLPEWIRDKLDAEPFGHRITSSST